ncbi:FAD-dependent oxidoreductase [Desulfonema magnum]|uniref:NADH:flavin oxidoreductase family protein n=1 Tax=Desulfonema magnum TaxID=45655 RepID=A0A975GN75_9BACT|nr:FAD-dependent oxidoreductase [Desulfonema magnum]QTA87480.1 NADH:flavin oxidoreductase family protein [Desulfonema magnum]
MERMFTPFKLGDLELANRFVFPPIKLGYGNPDGTVTDRQLTFYRQIAKNGPGLIIIEPVSVTADGKEHPKQPCVHLPESAAQLRKIADVIHAENRLACLHLNHGGAAANPKLIGGAPKAPSVMTCVAREGNVSQEITEQDIQAILDGYGTAAEKARQAGFDVIEIQGGHGYLISQFLNGKLNTRKDRYGQDRTLFAREAISKVRENAGNIPLILRISGNEMSPEFGISPDDLLPLLKLAEEKKISLIHVGMGNACFSPPWYFHHAALPDKPQTDALSWVRENTSLPLLAAGRMGRKEKVIRFLDQGLAQLVALGRPLIADPDLPEKWQKGADQDIRYCGYCLQGCLHRMKSGVSLGCNLNPAVGLPPLARTDTPMKVLIAGGGPAGLSAALYMDTRGHEVTLAEKTDAIGGQFSLAWQAPGKEKMKQGLESLERAVKSGGASLLMNRTADADLVREIQPDLLVWAVGAVQNIPEIKGLEHQHVMTSLEYFQGAKAVKGPRVLVVGAGRAGLEIAEKLGKEGFDVVATKRTDPIGSMMEMITKKLALMRIDQMQNVTLMPHTTVKEFFADKVDVEQDGEKKSLDAFQTVILASGMLSAPGPDNEVSSAAPKMEIIGDANEVKDVFSAVHAGYELALRY